MKVSAIKTCTVGVSNLPHSLKLFRDLFKLRVETEGFLSVDELRAYHLPESMRAQFAELSCAGYSAGRLRLVQYDPPTTERVRADHEGGDSSSDIGPKAIDFYVADPIGPRVIEIENAGYRFRSRPVRHWVGNTESEECLFSGPDGVPVLIMVGHQHSDAERRSGCLAGPYSEIATISVVAEDLESSRAFYQQTLGLQPIVDAETASEHRGPVSDLTGVPSGTGIHFRMYAESGEPSGKILLVHFSGGRGCRLANRMRPGKLGFSLMSLETDDLNTLHEALKKGRYSILTPPTSIRSAHGERRMLLVEGPNADLYEIFELLSA